MWAQNKLPLWVLRYALPGNWTLLLDIDYVHIMQPGFANYEISANFLINLITN